MKLEPRPGFDWNHVAWGKPDSPRSALCSYCSAGIGEDDVPLILWSENGYAAQFCAACQATWWASNDQLDQSLAGPRNAPDKTMDAGTPHSLRARPGPHRSRL
jgi:hypothetical protein